MKKNLYLKYEASIMDFAVSGRNPHFCILGISHRDLPNICRRFSCYVFSVEKFSNTIPHNFGSSFLFSLLRHCLFSANRYFKQFKTRSRFCCEISETAMAFVAFIYSIFVRLCNIYLFLLYSYFSFGRNIYIYNKFTRGLAILELYFFLYSSQNKFKNESEKIISFKTFKEAA